MMNSAKSGETCIPPFCQPCLGQKLIMGPLHVVAPHSLKPSWSPEVRRLGSEEQSLVGGDRVAGPVRGASTRRATP
jgi:hypothetical protein